MNYDAGLPAKESYHFKEVTSLTGVKPYVLRFWETEFPQISSHLSESGKKLYRAEDLETVRLIKDLLFDQKLSIPQAKSILDQKKTEVIPSEIDVHIPMAIKSEELKKALEDIITKHSDSIEVVNNQGQSLEDTIEIPTEYTGVTKSESAYKLLQENQAVSSRDEVVAAPVKEIEIVYKDINEKDIVNLVHAKKKLTTVLSRINDISAAHGW